MGERPDDERMESTCQRLCCRRQSVLPRRARDDRRSREAPLAVQSSLERIEDAWHPLVLIDADRGPCTHRSGQVPLDRLTHFNIIEVDHRAAYCLSEAAEHRRFSRRPWTVQRDHRLGAHLFGQQITDTAGNEAIELHAVALAGSTMQTQQT